VGADVLPFVGTSSVVGTGVARRFSFNLFAGYTAGLAGFELGGLVDVESAFACGAQVAGLANVVTGPVEGVQVATVGNFGRWVHGAQLGLVNAAAGALRGAQVGLADVATGGVKGAQVGLVNVTVGDVRGAQVGLVNVATGAVSGAQVGLVNVADRSTLSVGVASVVRRGHVQLDLWGQESGLLMAGVTLGGDYFHNVLGAGARPVGTGGRWAFTVGFGGRLPVSSRFYLDLDALAYSLHDQPSFGRVTWILQQRLMVGLRLIKPLALYAGPTFDVSFSPRDLNPQLSPYAPWVFSPNTPTVVQGWLGGVLGMRVF
jgi:hypothetical protein